MYGKLIGAILIIGGCGFLGFNMASASKKEESDLRQLISALDFMQCELQYRMTPLPDLCAMASREHKGSIGHFLKQLTLELENQVLPDVASCVRASLEKTGQLPKRVHNALALLGSSLGRFDAEGQMRGMEQVRQYCREEIAGLADHREMRLRSYQTLSLCAGAALAIIFV